MEILAGFALALAVYFGALILYYVCVGCPERLPDA
jgi:hypothetical protein